MSVFLDNHLILSLEYPLAKKNLHEYTRGARDKYEVWSEWLSDKVTYLAMDS